MMVEATKPALITSEEKEKKKVVWPSPTLESSSEGGTGGTGGRPGG